jgi:hypothetical protein
MRSLRHALSSIRGSIFGILIHRNPQRLPSLTTSLVWRLDRKGFTLSALSNANTKTGGLLYQEVVKHPVWAYCAS